MTDVKKLEILHINTHDGVEKFYISPHHTHDGCGRVVPVTNMRFAYTLTSVQIR